MEIQQLLQKSGLNEKEASIYLATLELGTSSVHGIADKAGIKRPTAYIILKQLENKGLVSLVPRARKVLYAAESPEKIISNLARQQELMKQFLPNMLAVYNTKKEKPQVLLFEGKEAVREVYEKILNAKQVDFFATTKDIVSVYPDYPKRLEQKALEKKLTVRELLTRTPEDIKFADNITHSANYQHRFTPAGQEFFTDNVLFDGNVVFFSYEPRIFAVQIQSQGIYQSLQTLFNLAWQNADEYGKIGKQ